MGDVLEYLIDGTSGISPEGVDGLAMVVGVCSKGQEGKGYLLNGRSDLAGMLGVGPLVDRLRDVFATAGQDSAVVAVPVAGQASSYYTPVLRVGSAGASPNVLGVPQKNAEIVVRVKSAGQIGVATVEISTDNGVTFGSPTTCTATLVIPQTGISFVFADDTEQLEAGTAFHCVTRLPIGKIYQYGDGPSITVTGEVSAAAELQLEIVKAGGMNEGTYRLSVDGGDNYGKTKTIPANGVLSIYDYGVTVEFQGAYQGGTVYTCRLLAPAPGIVDVMEALETPLSLYDVEFIYITGPSDSVDWAAAAAKTEELWNAHRPTFIKMEARLPYDNEDLNDWTAQMIAERADFASRFVQVCVQFGEVTDSSGLRKLRNWAGLQTGRTISIPVQRATGRVRDGNIVQGTLPDGWAAVQPWLEDAGFLTAKPYAGLKGAYWADSRTMAEDTSDFRYEEVLRVVFKAVRKERIAALTSMYDELGDPLAPEGAAGLNYLKANIENALNTMTAAIPPELAAYVVEIPPNQDYVNNGVAVETTLIGIPIIRSIKLYNRYVYAGSKFDPRLEDSYGN